MPALTFSRRRLGLIGALVLALVASIALCPIRAEAEEAAAAGEPSAPPAETPPQVVYEKKTVLDFSDVTLEGELTRPEGSYLLNRKKARFGSLVQLRADFLPELQKSIDNL
ncbi:MAG: hypothetical protein LBM75_01200 [Myxococcales bacterium]|jgi:hypothetical protein|nr:hypothetical protein [Myxococcales bacterium]